MKHTFSAAFSKHFSALSESAIVLPKEFKIALFFK
jgi:hypothetical protein